MYKNKESNQLLKCPFCNGTASLDAIISDEPPRITHFVVCCHCDARSGIYATETEAIAKWNRRINEYGNRI